VVVEGKKRFSTHFSFSSIQIHGPTQLQERLENLISSV
jgi:hypothetical protein